jgi:nicotinamide mononucleotide transporter
MQKINKFLREEFLNGYTIFDKLFMIGMLLLQIIVFVINPDSVLGIISGISGVISVVLCAKGKISFYFIGFVQTVSYLYLAFDNRFYGEVIENVFYLVTMIWGIFIWKKHLKTDEEGSCQVEAKMFTPIQWILSIIGTAICTVIMGYWLTTIGSQQAYTDACTNVLAIFGQLLMIKRYKEQWIWWLVIDVLCFKMWLVAGNWSMVAMYIAWTVNCIYGWYNWSKLNKKNVENA